MPDLTRIDDRLATLLAGAEERLADAHLVHALDFIQRTSGEIDAPRALEVYSRLHYLEETDARVLKNRVLASFGRIEPDSDGHAPHTFVAVGGDVEWDVTASVFYRLRRRLGGRRNPRLRHWVKLHTGWVEAMLLKVHVQNVERLLDVVGTSDDAIGETLALYMRALRVRDSLHEAIDIAVCEHLYPERVPKQAPMMLRVESGGAEG